MNKQNTVKSNFFELGNSIRGKTIQEIQQNHPNKQLIKWQKLLTVILQTELAIHRINASLRLLKIAPTKEILSMSSMSEGAWIDYHYVTWSFWMYSFLEREKKLTSQIVRNLVKPNNPRYREIEEILLKSVESQKKLVGKVRHPEAHVGEGGPFEYAINTNLRNFSIIRSPVDFNSILVSCVPYRLRWYKFLRNSSELIFAETERICGELNQHINWANI